MGWVGGFSSSYLTTNACGGEKTAAAERGACAVGQRVFFVRWQYTQFVEFSFFLLVHNEKIDAVPFERLSCALIKRHWRQ